MKNSVAAFAASLIFSLFTSSAFAVSQTYVLDQAASMKADGDQELEDCVQSITVDSAANLPLAYLKKVSALKSTHQLIERSHNESIDSSVYSGKITESVYLTAGDLKPDYPMSVYERHGFTEFRKDGIRKAFIYNYELLNYRNSAELGEGEFCSHLYYKLKE